MAINPEHFQECDSRESDGMTVRLLWNGYTKETAIEIRDIRWGIHDVFIVPNSCALDAFQHPTVYAPAYREAVLVA